MCLCWAVGRLRQRGSHLIFPKVWIELNEMILELTWNQCHDYDSSGVPASPAVQWGIPDFRWAERCKMRDHQGRFVWFNFHTRNLFDFTLTLISQGILSFSPFSQIVLRLGSGSKLLRRFLLQLAWLCRVACLLCRQQRGWWRAFLVAGSDLYWSFWVSLVEASFNVTQSCSI